MTREEILDLAKRVEALTGPNFAIEREIFRVINPNATGLSIPKPYTASLDAAMQLVPTKPFPELRLGSWWWMVEVWPEECHAHIAYENGDRGIPEYGGKSRTSPLALTAAALRAIAESMEP
jgi:hypothetical protein